MRTSRVMSGSRCYTDKLAPAEEATEAAEDVAIDGPSVGCTRTTTTARTILLGVAVFGRFPPLPLSGATKGFVAH